MQMIAAKMQNLLTSAILIFKEKLIFTSPSNNYISGKIILPVKVMLTMLKLIALEEL